MLLYNSKNSASLTLVTLSIAIWQSSDQVAGLDLEQQCLNGATTIMALVAGGKTATCDYTDGNGCLVCGGSQNWGDVTWGHQCLPELDDCKKVIADQSLGDENIIQIGNDKEFSSDKAPTDSWFKVLGCRKDGTWVDHPYTWQDGWTNGKCTILFKPAPGWDQLPSEQRKRVYSITWGDVKEAVYRSFDAQPLAEDQTTPEAKCPGANQWKFKLFEPAEAAKVPLPIELHVARTAKDQTCPTNVPRLARRRNRM